MNTKLILTLGTSVIFSVLTGCASNSATQTGQILAGVGQVMAQGQQIPAPQQPATTPSIGDAATGTLIGILMQQMGITQPQAQSGAGMLMQYAQSKMSPSSFSQLQALPGMPSVPAGSNSIATAAALGSAFQQQGLSSSMIPQMIPVMLQYVTNTGGTGIAGSLGSALLSR